MNKLHESDDQLELYALDRLSETEVIRIEEHLVVCEACRERLEQTAAFAFAMRDVLKQHPELLHESPPSGWLNWLGLNRVNAGTRQFQWKPALAMAAMLTIAVATGIYFSNTRASLALVSQVPVASLQLMSLRGEIQTMPAARELELTLTDAPAAGAPFRMEMVDAAGAAQWTGIPQITATGLTARIAKPFPPGAYFVRLYGGSPRTLLHEYGFRVVEKVAP